MTHGITDMEDGMEDGTTHGTVTCTHTTADGTEAGTLCGDITITTARSTEAEASGTAGTALDMRPKTTAGSSQTGLQPAEASAQAAA